MLELLCFDLSANSPLKYLVNFFEELAAVGIRSEMIKELRNYTWALICDTHHSTLGLIATPRTIAITTLLLAATARKCEIPQIKDKDWWEHLGGNETQIVEAGLILHKFLSNSPFQITDQDQPGPATAKYLHASSSRKERSIDDTSANSEQNSSQNGNGHGHGNGTDRSDCNSQSDLKLPHNDKPNLNGENGKTPASMMIDEGQTSPTLHNVQHDSEPVKAQESGTDDALLKAAANDLSSHDQIKSANDISSNIDSDAKPSPKRKANEDIEDQRSPKRARSREPFQGDSEPSSKSSDPLKNREGHATKDVEGEVDIDSNEASTASEAEV